MTKDEFKELFEKEMLKQNLTSPAIHAAIH